MAIYDDDAWKPTIKIFSTWIKMGIVWVLVVLFLAMGTSTGCIPEEFSD